MMWPRLQLLKELLADDGIIFVSIDDNEQHRLRIMMDEIFGKDFHLATITVRSNPGGRDYGGIARTHDYVLMYGKTIDLEVGMVPVDEQSLPIDNMRNRFVCTDIGTVI